MLCLYIVVPCFNEEEILEKSISQLVLKMKELQRKNRINNNSKILFVDDGSMDSTWKIITSEQRGNPMVAGIKLSCNEGHQKAILSGMIFAKEYADAVITIDADLQQDINSIEQFIDKYEEGYDIVYGIRNDRKTDSFMKKNTAKLFYFMMKCLNGRNTIKNSADYRLMSKKSIEALEEYSEVNLYLRGLIPLMGFNSTVVYFDVKERTEGNSKYTMRKMFALAMDGITSFSILPIRAIAIIGLLVFMSSLVMVLYILVSWFKGITVSGWSSLATAIWMLGGVQLLSVGIVGEYVAKTYLETKHRPRYHIDVIAFKE